MADYFQHSIFTVAAPGATEDTGLFSTLSSASSASHRLVRLPYRPKPENNPSPDLAPQGYFYLHTYQTQHDICKEFTTSLSRSSLLLRSALLSRGWVFQEFMLSRRRV